MRVYPYQITGISAYKDPVENQHMRKILDKFVTGFFVVVLGIAWYCSTKFYIKPDKHSIVVYDVFGKEVELDDVRTDFKTHSVAQSYISEYKKRFKITQYLEFSKRFRGNEFSYEFLVQLDTELQIHNVSMKTFLEDEEVLFLLLFQIQK